MLPVSGSADFQMTTTVDRFTTSKPSHSWSKFSLWSLLVVMGLFGLTFAVCRLVGFGLQLVPTLGLMLGTYAGLFIALRKGRRSTLLRGMVGGSLGGCVGLATVGLVFAFCWVWASQAQDEIMQPLVGSVLITVPTGLLLGAVLGFYLSIIYVCLLGPKELKHRIKTHGQARR